MMNYELIRSSRRTVSLEVTKECVVRVRAPLRMPKGEIDTFVASHRTWVERQLTKRRAVPVRPEPTAGEIAELKARTRRLVEPAVARYAAHMQLQPSGIRITTARTRYGSCSGTNGLCFSCFLAECPAEAVELVVVHELCHIVHKNHGEKFYALLESVLPDWRERKKLLTMR
ncbi:MAG: M48 family metallopeptidase [Ruminococcaceae bacterium]|nr:M48 family metallopeptidase [Oscillospiraceae bacterium]